MVEKSCVLNKISSMAILVSIAFLKDKSVTF
jgi:hypothetical protein